ncbi:hypothetical protein QFZ63_000086 [Streptomyces sp. B3I7]|uniref:polyprenyl synthetase family protein n=1 Tax=Streptomyces sp. B3I7 TaxID=3042269 RepID=UPI002786C9DC|nr:class 1 isoprenoid biosynthesis enzyme [Streptomyces sp. B3I7]MDQ0808372.1 hypothetical protein [Streptomyces sp. B3I7]
MKTIDVTSSYLELLAREEEVTASVRDAIDRLSCRQPALAQVIADLIDDDLSTTSIFRMLPFPIIGSLSGRPESVVPLMAASRLWWVGAEIFDDLADGEYDAKESGPSPSQASVGSAACLTAIPLDLLDHQMVPDCFRAAWASEMIDSSLRAAEGQLADLSSLTAPPSWAAVMKSYAGKTGAPYARDAAMTAQLAGVDDEAVRGWRNFGRLFGVLRQLTNDRCRPNSPEIDVDMTNGTRTLLFAHATEVVSGSSEAEKLRALYAEAQRNPEVHEELREYLSQSSISVSYNDRVYAIYRRLCILLDYLAPQSADRDLIRWMLNDSVDAALLHDAEDAE